MTGTIYPLGVDGFAQLPVIIDGVSPIRAEDVNRLRDAIIAVERELGVNPSGTYATVKARLDALASLIDLLPNTGGGASTSLLLDFLSVGLEQPADKAYNVVTNIPYDGYVFSVATKSSAGTATGDVLINGVALGGGPNSISTTEEVVFHTTDRAFLPGDDIQFRISSNSGAQDIIATIAFIRFVEVESTGSGGGGGTFDPGDGYVTSSSNLSADNSLARFDGTSGLTIQASGAILDDAGKLTGITSLGVNTSSPASTFHVAGSISSAIRTVTATGSMTSTDSYVLVNASSGSITLALPSASDSVGRSYNVKRIDGSSNSVTIVRSGSDTIDGSVSWSLSVQYESLTFVSDGSGWYIF